MPWLGLRAPRTRPVFVPRDTGVAAVAWCVRPSLQDILGFRNAVDFRWAHYVQVVLLQLVAGWSDAGEGV